MSEGASHPYDSPATNVATLRPGNATRIVLVGMVAVFVGVLAYRVHWMYQREDCFFNSMNRTGCGPVAAHRGDAPWSIRMLGARGYASIGVAKNSPEPWNGEDFSMIVEVRRLFPEAEVYELSYEELMGQWERAK
jgi:hypothetical protein